VQEAIELAAHGVDHRRGAMSGVEAADATSKINQAVAVNILDDRPFRLGNEDRRGVKSRMYHGGIAPNHEG